jgi:SAM-dependent methyltransferase
VRLLHADILDLRRHVEPDSVDYACCMFSTFGLIAGARNRHRFLRRVRQVLRPGGLLALHAHSRGCNIFTAEGQRFLLTNAVATFRGRAEWGDKYLRWYRGIEDMFVHVFSRKELENALTRAGYTIRHLINLNHARNGELRPNLAATWRANGYLVLAEA